MKNIKAILVAGLAILTSNPVDGKKHYMANTTPSKDHPIVKQNAPMYEWCLFEFENDDKFCTQTKSYLDVGWEFDQ